jgi:hypothetical protein
MIGTAHFWQYPRQVENRGRHRKYTLVSDPAHEFNPGLRLYEDETRTMLSYCYFTDGTILNSNKGQFIVRQSERGQRLVKLEI